MRNESDKGGIGIMTNGIYSWSFRNTYYYLIKIA
jgi:hypothetical protein